MALEQEMQKSGRNIQLRVDDELLAICRGIIAEDRSEEEWAGLASFDTVQTTQFRGGFCAIERLFTLIYTAPDEEQYAIHISLADAEQIAVKSKTYVELHAPF